MSLRSPRGDFHHRTVLKNLEKVRRTMSRCVCSSAARCCPVSLVVPRALSNCTRRLPETSLGTAHAAVLGVIPQGLTRRSFAGGAARMREKLETMGETMIVQRQLPKSVRKMFSRGDDALTKEEIRRNKNAQNAIQCRGYRPKGLVAKLNGFVAKEYTNAKIWNTIMSQLLEKKASLDPGDCCHILGSVIHYLYSDVELVEGTGRGGNMSTPVLDKVAAALVAKKMGALGTSAAGLTGRSGTGQDAVSPASTTPDAQQETHLQTISMSVPENQHSGTLQDSAACNSPVTLDEVEELATSVSSYFSLHADPSSRRNKNDEEHGDDEQYSIFESGATSSSTLSNGRAGSSTTPAAENIVTKKSKSIMHVQTARLQRQIQRAALSRNGLNVELTASVIEECLTILADPVLVSKAVPAVLAAETLRTLEILEEKGKACYRGLIEDIRSKFLQMLSVALDASDAAEAADDARRHSQEHKMLIKKRGLRAAEIDLERNSHAMSYLELRGIYIALASSRHIVRTRGASSTLNGENTTGSSSRRAAGGGLATENNTSAGDHEQPIVIAPDDAESGDEIVGETNSAAALLVEELTQNLTRKMRKDHSAGGPDPRTFFMIAYAWMRLHPEFHLKQLEKELRLHTKRVFDDERKQSFAEFLERNGNVDFTRKRLRDRTLRHGAFSLTEQERLKILKNQQKLNDEKIQNSGLAYLAAQGMQLVLSSRLPVPPLEALAALETFTVFGRVYPRLRQKLVVYVTEMLRAMNHDEFLVLYEKVWLCRESPLGAFDESGVILLKEVMRQRNLTHVWRGKTQKAKK